MSLLEAETETKLTLIDARNLYKIMYRIIDTCYGQNLGLEEHRTESEIISLVLKIEEELEDWKAGLVHMHMRVYDTPITSQNLEKAELKDKIVERFYNVLSARYHNLQILLHRPVLENFLDTSSYTSSSRARNGTERGNKIQQLGIGSIETCVHSATVVISIVHTIVLSTDWRRDLLGAWNYSLFYSKSQLPCTCTGESSGS